VCTKGVLDGVDDDGGEGWRRYDRRARKRGIGINPSGGDFRGKRHGPRTRKRDSRKLKEGYGRLVVFKKAICGLEIRPIYYGATATGGGR